MHNTHAPAPSSPYQQISMLSNDFIHRFEAVVAKSSRIWLHAAVTPLNKVLLSANFLFFVAVTVFRLLESFITVLIFHRKFYRQAEVSITVILEQELDKTPGETYTASSVRVGWPNIGPAAAEPAGPAPTALCRSSLPYLVCYICRCVCLMW